MGALTMATYTVNVVDSEAPPAWIELCSEARPGAQSGGRCRWRVVTDRPAKLEAALEADPSVTEYGEFPDPAALGAGFSSVPPGNYVCRIVDVLGYAAAKGARV